MLCLNHFELRADGSVARSAIKSAGNCSVPITLVVLGSYFVEEPDPSSSPATPGKNAGGRKSALKRKASTASTLRERFSAYLSLPSSKSKDEDSLVQSKGKKGEGRTVFVSVTSRMIVAPLGKSVRSLEIRLSKR